MPGTACTKFTNEGANNGPCDGEHFVPLSILVQPGTQCMLFHDGGCTQGSKLVKSENGAPACGHDIGLSSNINSFICVRFPEKELA